MNLRQLNLKSKRTTLSLAVAGVVAITAVSWGISGSNEAHADAAPAAAQGVPVEVAEVVSRKITDWSSFSGRLEAVDRVEIRPQVTGVLTAVHFKDGALVKKGDILFTIDQRQYAAEVFGAEARADYTASELARAERLVFMPEWYEPASRLALEARFLGCEVVSNERLGVGGEPWWTEPDEIGLEVVRTAPERFWTIVERFRAARTAA